MKVQFFVGSPAHGGTHSTWSEELSQEINKFIEKEGIENIVSLQTNSLPNNIGGIGFVIVTMLYKEKATS